MRGGAVLALDLVGRDGEEDTLQLLVNAALARRGQAQAPEGVRRLRQVAKRLLEARHHVVVGLDAFEHFLDPALGLLRIEQFHSCHRHVSRLGAGTESSAPVATGRLESAPQSIHEAS